MYACKSFNELNVELLLNYGVDITQRSFEEGFTGFILAC